MITLLQTRRQWECPACGLEDVTFEARPHTRYHPCPKMRGLIVGMVPKGTKAKVELHEREDYVGTDIVQLDPELGRPVMSVVTTRDDGQDTTVYAPTATGRIA